MKTKNLLVLGAAIGLLGCGAGPTTERTGRLDSGSPFAAPKNEPELTALDATDEMPMDSESEGDDEVSTDAAKEGAECDERFSVLGETVRDVASELTWQREVPDLYTGFITATGYCDDLELGGHDNWRVPTKDELLGLLTEDSQEGVDIDACAFPDTPRDFFWSSSKADRDGYVWDVSFYRGVVSLGSMGLDPYTHTSAERAERIAEHPSAARFNCCGQRVRCVRDDEEPRQICADELHVVGDTVEDERSGLTWQRTPAGPLAWFDAETYCEELELEGASDWRMPTADELLTIVDDRSFPAIDPCAFPGTEPGLFWTSSICLNLQPPGYDCRYRVYFSIGGLNVDFHPYPYEGLMRCVRE